ncbi:MAG: hypothetical protein LBF97_06420 [Elusimicrobiota bacterium]|jgi:hypothetical protein|nr:hypothetical protein [Elusimicrobiota bacterium]
MKNQKKKLFLIYFFILLIFTRSNILANPNFYEFEQYEFLEKIPKFEDNFFDTWMIYNSFNFEIYYYNEIAVANAIKYIDKAYDFIIKDLDYMFYIISKKIKIYIYKNQRDYVRKTGINGWAAGHADIRRNTIYSFEQENLLENVLVHELTHLIFDSYMGYPRSMSINWLHEGLAVYEDKQFLKKKWNLKDLKKTSPPHLKEIFKTHTGLETNESKISIWYIQVGTIIAFLFSLDRTGFKIFCENLKKYKNVEVALNATYPWDFKTVNELDKKWRKWLYEQPDII